ncbi:unnamed protein product [Prorocentrum cordatum]|uniref:Membrane transporter protein n=1 Tax=Prorocentrum cordatum TaxID=2364126 RepID=A0ABN9S8U9_9DINO|nr:unnamed protein product [Polarella glacialis]
MVQVFWLEYPDPLVWWQLAAVCAAWAWGAFIIGCFGVGGGVIFVPAMLFLPGVEAPLAVGTTFCSVLLLNAARWLQLLYYGDLDVRSALLLLPPAAVGALLGQALLPYVPSFVVAFVVSAISVFAGAQTTKRVVRERRAARAQASAAATAEPAAAAVSAPRLGAESGSGACGGESVGPRPIGARAVVLHGARPSAELRPHLEGTAAVAESPSADLAMPAAGGCDLAGLGGALCPGAACGGPACLGAPLWRRSPAPPSGARSSLACRAGPSPPQGGLGAAATASPRGQAAGAEAAGAPLRSGGGAEGGGRIAEAPLGTLGLAGGAAGGAGRGAAASARLGGEPAAPARAPSRSSLLLARAALAEVLAGRSAGDVAALMLISLVTAFLSSLAGVGGPVILFPLWLMWDPTTPMKQLVGLSIPFSCVLVVSSAVGALTLGTVDLGLASIFSVVSTASALLGGMFMKRMADSKLKLVVGIVLMLVGVASAARTFISLAA